MLLEPCESGKDLSLLPGYAVSQKGHNTSEETVSEMSHSLLMNRLWNKCPQLGEWLNVEQDKYSDTARGPSKHSDVRSKFHF